MSFDTITYWARTSPVEAVRLTVINMRGIAANYGLVYKERSDENDEKTSIPHIASARRGYGFEGDWIVISDGGDFQFYTNKVFSEKFRTLSEELAEDEKYAKVFQLVMVAMAKQNAATYHGESCVGMDLVAAEIAKQIIEEL